jgi:hypothetical protein
VLKPENKPSIEKACGVTFLNTAITRYISVSQPAVPFCAWIRFQVIKSENFH